MTVDRTKSAPGLCIEQSHEEDVSQRFDNAIGIAVAWARNCPQNLAQTRPYIVWKWEGRVCIGWWEYRTNVCHESRGLKTVWVRRDDGSICDGGAE